MISTSTAPAAEQMGQVATMQQREASLNAEMSRLEAERAERQRELGEIAKAIDSAACGTDSRELAGLLGQRQGLELMIGKLGLEVQKLVVVQKRAAEELADLNREAAQLYGRILPQARLHSKLCVQRLGDAEAQLGAARRQVELAEEAITRHRTRLLELMGTSAPIEDGD